MKIIGIIIKLSILALRHPAEVFSHVSLSNLKLLVEYFRFGDFSNLDYMISIYFPARKAPDKATLQFFDDLRVNEGKLSFNPSTSPVISIIIPVFNNYKYTYSCLKSIIANTDGPSYEIIIADDCSIDETIKIKEYVENVIVLRNNTNLGFIPTCNRAALMAKGQYLLFLNNDTNVQKAWLPPLLELMEKDERAGIVGAKLVYPDGRLQEAGGIIWSDGSGMNYGKFDDPDRSQYNYVKQVDYVSGACLMIRRIIWEKLGGFDEQFAPAYYEDTDLAFATRGLGYKVLYQPKSVVVHFEGASCGTDTTSGAKAYQPVNREKFREKHVHALLDQCEPGRKLFLAREGGKRKVILIIDQGIPAFDKDAGSRSTFLYVCLFTRLNLKVIFLSDTFSKDEPYVHQMEQMGVEVLYGEEYRVKWQEWLSNNGSYIDFVFFNRPRLTTKYLDSVRKATRARLIYQGHDLHYLRLQRRYALEKEKRLLVQALRFEKIERDIISKSDVVLSFSTYEKQIIEEKWGHNNVRLVPLFFYSKGPKVFSCPDNREGLLFVGSANHAPNIDALIWFVNEILPMIKKEVPEVKLNIVGDAPPGEIQKLSSDDVIVHGFMTDEELALLYATVKLVVVPMRFGAGVKGKVIEPMYYGVPLVGTSIALEGIPGILEIIQPKDDVDGFVKEVVSLYQDKLSWVQVSQGLRKCIEDHFSEEHAQQVVESFLGLQSPSI